MVTVLLLRIERLSVPTSSSEYSPRKQLLDYTGLRRRSFGHFYQIEIVPEMERGNSRGNGDFSTGFRFSRRENPFGTIVIIAEYDDRMLHGFVGVPRQEVGRPRYAKSLSTSGP